MGKYKYPCMFRHHKKDNVWEAHFPDFDGTYCSAFTGGKTWEEVRYMAHDLLNLVCLMFEEDKVEPLPKPSKHVDPALFGDDIIVIWVAADTEKYAKAVDQFKRVGRWRNAEKARIKYIYNLPILHDPWDDVGKVIDYPLTVREKGRMVNKHERQ